MKKHQGLEFGALLEVEMLKSARCCSTKHISKSKCTKHTTFRSLLEVKMFKKCTPLWCEAHFEVKSVKKTDGFGALLDVETSFCVAGAWDCAPSEENVRVV